MSFVQIFVHAVWGTKRREPLLDKDFIPVICDHIHSNAIAKGFFILELNAVADHVHCLMALKSEWSIAKQMQMIKGESANWVNKQRLTGCYFEWADEYFAASVSKDKLEVVKDYIRRQEEHHRKITFKEEYERFPKKFGFSHG